MMRSVMVILVLCLCAAGLIGCGSAGVRSGGSDKSGSCGENMTWEYDTKTKTLTISGEGEMVTEDRFMWSDYPIRKLVISEGVTSIAAEAFYSNHDLNCEVTFPSTLREIGEFAFYGCSGLKGELVFPDAVETIGDYAFESCEKITRIRLSKSLKSIGTEAFEDCTAASGTIEFPEGLETIGRVAFYHCEKLKGDLILPDSLTSVGSYAFSDCGFDGRLRLPQGLKEIPLNCFSYSESLKGDLIIPSGVETIGTSAFSGCTFDGKITLSEGLRVIEDRAFSNCKNLGGELVIPSTVTYLGENAFENDGNLTGLKILADLPVICSHAFRNCESMTGTLTLPDGLYVIGDDAFARTGFSSIEAFPDNLRTVGRGSFAYCEALGSLPPFPDSLVNIREIAFCGCSELSGKLTVPDGVYAVGESAFSGCGKLTEAVFGRNVRSVGVSAFRGCESLGRAVFTGRMPDYYTADEGYPTFPENCRVTFSGSGEPFREDWEKLLAEKQKEKQTESSGREGSGADEGGMFAEKEMPYDWTSSLTGWEYTGAGIYSDVVLMAEDGMIRASINGRPFDEAAYTADPNDYDGRTVRTEGICCRDGWVTDLKYEEAGYSENKLTGEMVMADGTIRTIVFTTGSEDKLYFRKDEQGDIVYIIPEI